MYNIFSYKSLVCSIFLLFGVEQVKAAPFSQVDTSLLVIKNVNVLDLKRGKFRNHRTVGIFEGRIISTNFSKRKWKTARVIDLSGKYLIPGLIDTHVHVTAHRKNNMQTTYSHLNYFLRNGITSVRDASGDGEALLEAKQSIMEGKHEGANVYFAAFMAGDWYFNRDIKLRKDPYRPWEQLITQNTNLDSAMIEAKSSGATGVKLYHSFDKILLPKVVAAAKKYGLKTWGHLMMYPATPMEVVASGLEVPSHVFMLENMVTDTGFHKRKVNPVYKEQIISNFDIKPFCDAMKANHAILDATLCVSEDRDPWIFTMLKKIHEQGVEISAGTDQIVDLNRRNPRLFDELDSFVEKCGFSNNDAIKAATITAAKVIGQQDNIGSIEKGKTADLLVLNGNPLKNIKELRNIKLVIQSGKIVQRY